MTGLEGTDSLVRLALRRDRLILPAWVLLFASMAGFSAAASVDLFPDVASRVQAAEAVNGTPSLVALYGRVYDPTSLGAVSMIKMGGVGAALLAVLAFMLVVRHTRAEEETGRLELVAGGVVGRYASLSAALAVAVGTMVAIGALTAVALVGAGLPVDGSLAFGAAWAGTGTAFAAVGAVAAQLTTSARAANGLAAATLGTVYVLRAVGDVSAAGGTRWLTWLSPVGWGQHVRPYAGDRWSVLALPVAFAVLMTVVAVALVRRRDLAAGVLADRPGPAQASSRLRSPLALAWRLQRGVLAAWLTAFALLGLVFGSIASDIGTFFSTPAAREMLTALGGQAGVTDSFLALELSMVGVIASAYGVQAAMRLHQEETALRAEPVLATRTQRVAWASSHVTVAVVGTTALMAVAGLSAGAAYALSAGDPQQVLRMLGAALVQLPAAWVLTGIVVALFGLAPRVVALAWAALVLFLLVGELGPLFELPQWALGLSPYTHVPRVPAVELTVAPLLWLTVVAVALTAAGLVAFRRRDVG